MNWGVPRTSISTLSSSDGLASHGTYPLYHFEVKRACATSRPKRSPCNSQLAIEVGRSAVPHQGSHLAAHSRVFPSFIILIRPSSRRSTLFARKNRKLQGHKVPTEHTEQKQAENIWDSQVQPQFFCHFVKNGVISIVAKRLK